MATQTEASATAALLILALFPVSVLSNTLASDVQALHSLKRGVNRSSIPSFSYLHTWDFSEDPCETTENFLGVLCSFPLDNSSSRITEIQLDSAGYEGFLMPSICNLTALTVLSLNRNRFRGPIPESVSNLRKLTNLSLSDNFLTGHIPKRITQLKELRIIDLSHNNLSGAIPAKISQLRSLTHLSLAKNQIMGKIPSLNGLWKLEVLELDNNQLVGSLPKLPTSLRTVSVSHNDLKGHILHLHRLKLLESLDLSDNMLSGTISHEILASPEIVRVNISFNQFTSLKVIKFTGKESRLSVLDAEGNHLQGHLPINLITYESLREVNLGDNRFYGLIPQAYLRKLNNSWKSLYLDNNYLTGEVPQQFGKLTRQIRGSIANNCLDCPMKITMCQQGQKPKSLCTRYNAGGF